MNMRKKCIAPIALFLWGLGASAAAQECAVDVGSADMLKFDKNSIVVDTSCESFTVNLTHTGKLPKNAMGHNWVLSKAEDVPGVAAEGMKAGLDNNYVKPGDERVVAFTEIIGGGERTSVSFDVSQLEKDVNYTYFCSFPGHSGVMQGTLTLK